MRVMNTIRSDGREQSAIARIAEALAAAVDDDIDTHYIGRDNEEESRDPVTDQGGIGEAIERQLDVLREMKEGAEKREENNGGEEGSF